jgi:hypothetical protein
VALGVAVGAAVVFVGVAFAVPVPDGADVDASLGASEGFPLPEHPAARIIKQTRNVMRMPTSIPEKCPRACFFAT